MSHQGGTGEARISITHFVGRFILVLPAISLAEDVDDDQVEGNSGAESSDNADRDARGLSGRGLGRAIGRALDGRSRSSRARDGSSRGGRDGD